MSSTKKFGIVEACDVTQDIAIEDLSPLLTIINAYKRYPKWVLLQYNNNGYALEKVAKTPRSKRRLILYDKAKEMGKKKNTDFLKMLSNGDEVREYFADKTRMELNLTSAEAIRKVLKISRNGVQDVLGSDATPIYDTLMEALQLPDEVETFKNVSEFERSVILRWYDQDFDRLKSDLRPFYTNISGLNKAIAKYRNVAPIIVPFNVEWLKDLFKPSA